MAIISDTYIKFHQLKMSTINGFMETFTIFVKNRNCYDYEPHNCQNPEEGYAFFPKTFEKNGLDVFG